MRYYSPSHITLFSFFTVTIIGTLILTLSITHQEPILFQDILFTVISACTGTGLLTIPLDHFSLLGQSIIIFLTQVGALGLIILTLFFAYYLLDTALPEELHAPKILGLHKKNVKSIIGFIFFFTLGIEAIGALLLFQSFKHVFPTGQAFFHALFHAVSAFSNAGFSTFADSMEDYTIDHLALTTLSALMIAGTIGFITLRAFFRYGVSVARRHKKRYRFLVSTWIAWITTLIIFTTALIIFMSLEYNYAFNAMSPTTTFSNALFNAISSMGSGFNSVPVGSMQLATLLVVMVVAFIGTSPGSTGSGIKTTTISIFFATLYAVIRNKPYVKIRGSIIPYGQLNKAMAIIALSIMWVAFTTFLLLIVEQGYSFFQLKKLSCHKLCCKTKVNKKVTLKIM